MVAYLLKRFALVVPTFLGITILIFAITRFVPGGPVERMLANMQPQGDGASASAVVGQNSALSEEQLADLNKFYGLDKPVTEAYLDWLSRLVQFDLGESTRYYEPVTEMIFERLPVSAMYGGITFFISYFISIPLGYYKALKHGSVFDSASSIMIFVGYALPGYVVGVLLITLFSYHLEWFPMGGFVDDDFDDFTTLSEQVTDILWHAVLPLICYLIGDFATLTMTMKNNLMENLSSDYIRTAIAKGLPFRQAIRKHALRNSLIPIASHFGNSLLFFMTGSFLIEVIFDINGIGLLGYESIVERDYPVVMGIVAINALVLLLGNILSDVCVALVDPRVKFGA
ncbi:ABC transporter permease subunit [Vibrio fortis]|jgi:microcin C transport system permease protein|uniref:ABC transporter permease subunit n=2 Tax=Vibrio fortis TaxID=212667 RepID=A0A066UHV5_9VIBR|nr:MULTISPECIES: ABC transporter permease subunit [Vibrio]KAB0300522.1 ABC transporter permease subunit [Vibrio fortis]KDN27011.1 peptide ABC transporter permease [Vibrio fortis]MCG9630337.1 ABC transporter permease subunit [Vibrio sp. Isolate30]MDK9760639.1 ABC transporter permease subunit [Vibrio sp. D420a]QFT12513.1 Inner membrane ABC transporter permease protein YejB [Vibrio sp. THAF190c]|tara:strand:- start:305 stop:1330 length:1026 start_codon:yes stop_codon:yes gene_type:complete